MSLEDFDLWYNIDPETASPVERKHVYLDDTLPKLLTIRWNTGSMWSGRSIELLEDVGGDFDAWCEEKLPYHWQGLYMLSKFPDGATLYESEQGIMVRVQGQSLMDRLRTWVRIQIRRRRTISVSVGDLDPEDIVFIEDDIAHGVGGG